MGSDVRYQHLKGSTLVKALGYLRYSKGWVLVGMSASILMACLQLYLPWMMKTLFDILTRSHPASLKEVVLTLVIVGASAGICEALSHYANAQSAERILITIRDQLYIRLRELPLEHFQKEQTGRIMSGFSVDAPAFVKLYNPVLGEAFVSTLQLLAAFIILGVVFGWLTVLAPLACGLYLIVPFLSVPRLRELSEKTLSLSAQLSADLHESISATREVKAFGREEWDFRRLGYSFRAFLPLQHKIGVLQIMASSNALIYWSIAGFFYWFGGRKVLAHEMTIGSLFAMVWYFTFLDMPIRRLIGVNDQLQSALAAGSRVFDLLQARDSAPDISEESAKLPSVSGRVTFESVNFAYQRGKSVLRDVSLCVSPGERVAIVGPSGAGKSTLISLIPRLHNVRSGRILIDGRDISRVNLDSLRKQIGIVFQDTFLFNVSIRENIRFARLNATDEDVIAAAITADADPFVAKFPRGYDTEVGERGAALSAGQRQRIAIARAILLDPRILILDEASSCLDTPAEMVVCKALEQLMRGRTTFIVSHRLATIANTDQIVVLDQGQIIGIGDHHHLMRQCDWYRRSYQLQKAAHDTDPYNSSAAFPD